MAPANSSSLNTCMPTSGSAESQLPWRCRGCHPVPVSRGVTSRNQCRDLDGTCTSLSGYHQPTPTGGWASFRRHPGNPGADHRLGPRTGQPSVPECPHKRPDHQAFGAVHGRSRNRQVSSQSPRQCATLTETPNISYSSQAQQATGDGRHVDCNFRHFKPPLLRRDIRHPGNTTSRKPLAT